MSDAAHIRKLIDSIEKPRLDEAFGAPMGLRQEIGLWFKSFNNPAAAAQLTAGNYANALNLNWRKAGLENATGTDFIQWYENARFTGADARSTKIGTQYVTQVVSQVTNNDLSKKLTDQDLQKIMLGLGQIERRSANKMHTNLLKKGTQKQESTSLELLQALRQSLPAMGSSITLSKLANEISNKSNPSISLQNVDKGMAAFAKDYANMRPPPLDPLPRPFRASNNRKLSPQQQKLLISKLADLILEIVIVNDQVGVGQPPPPPPQPPTPGPDPMKTVTDMIVDLRSQNYTDDMIKFIISTLKGGTP